MKNLRFWKPLAPSERNPEEARSEPDHYLSYRKHRYRRKRIWLLAILLVGLLGAGVTLVVKYLLDAVGIATFHKYVPVDLPPPDIKPETELEHKALERQEKTFEQLQKKLDQRQKAIERQEKRVKDPPR